MAKEQLQTNVVGGDTNPNDIEKFVKFSEKTTVFSSAKNPHYKTVGTPITLPKVKAEKWVEKGWATPEAPEEKAAKAKKA